MQPHLNPSSDAELNSFYADPDYWELVNAQQAVYNLIANNQKKEQILKSPVIFFNHYCMNGVIATACSLRDLLESKAEKKARPIVLFILPQQLAENTGTLLKIKQSLIENGIAEDQLKIKTNVIDELEGIDLLSSSCSIRYIISTNKLRKSWHCPAVYVLVPLVHSSRCDDLQEALNILLPHPLLNSTCPLLNAAYILTFGSRYENFLQSLYTAGVPGQEIIINDARHKLLRQASVFDVINDERSPNHALRLIREMAEKYFPETDQE
ncbi:MAG TPA: hypothetical protein VFM99_00385 [Chitinophagales bacterium]|nr:hypothetical protein [Chitinophagales bacterium]